MILARLDNEVIFKKAFTDPFVLKAFVKDIVGIDINPDRIETEKSFMPRMGNINFKYDIFAEDTEKRVIVEIQRVEYDHNFDRFLHYHLQGITEQQRSSEDYTVARTVYTIVVMTAPYRANLQTGEIVRDEVLISKMNPQNLQGFEQKIFNHELIFLNPNYRTNDTPAQYRDWLDLVYESIHHPESPHINAANAGVMRVSDIITYDNLSPEELEESKKEAGRRKVQAMLKEEGFSEGIERGMERGMERGKEEVQTKMIEKLLLQGAMTIEEIAAFVEVSAEYVQEIQERMSTTL